MSTDRKASPAYRVAKKILFAMLLLCLLIVLLGLGGRFAFIIELPIRFVFGWFFHAWKALPPFLEQWREAVVPAGCLLAAGVLAHRFVRRWVEVRRPALNWRVRHTAAVLALVLSGSAAAIAASGVAHQLFWIGRGDFLVNRGKAGERTHATNNARQIMLHVVEFQDAHGRHPYSLGEMDMPAHLEWFQPKGTKVPEPFTLLRPGSTNIALDGRPVIVSPILDGGETCVIGYGDMDVRAIPAKDLAKMIGQDRMGKSGGGR